jgi:hypothetical protein
MGAELQLRVSDSSRAEPQRLPTIRGLSGGYGWKVIQRLCSSVPVDVEPDGKTITVALALALPLP